METFELIAKTFQGLEEVLAQELTINAMAYNDESGLVDAFNGEKDLEAGTIRCVGNPHDRFGEDALRMLRAVRFAAQLGFEIEPQTLTAIRDLAENLRAVSAERIQMELVKLLTSAHPQEMRTVYETGLTRIFMPEFDTMMKTEQHNKHHCYSVGEHTLHTLDHVAPDKVLRLTMLLHDVAKPVCLTTDEADPETPCRWSSERLRRGSREPYRPHRPQTASQRP